MFIPPIQVVVFTMGILDTLFRTKASAAPTQASPKRGDKAEEEDRSMLLQPQAPQAQSQWPWQQPNRTHSTNSTPTWNISWGNPNAAIRLTRPGFLAPGETVVFLNETTGLPEQPTSPNTTVPTTNTTADSHDHDASGPSADSTNRQLTESSNHPPQSPHRPPSPSHPRKQLLSPITHISPNGQFIDASSASRIVRGMAISYKAAPYLPISDHFDPVASLESYDLRLFEKMGLNVIRLGIPWAAVQPQRGPDGFNMTFLDDLKTLVRNCSERGIYVILECHQDLFSERFTGDGMPSWAITRDLKTLPFPLPMIPKTAKYTALSDMPTNMKYTNWWGLLHGADAVTRAYWGLYTNYDGIQTEFGRFWEKLAETFKEQTNILGYELLNEPWISARNTLDIPQAFLFKSETESLYLQQMYDRIASMIRKHQADAIIFWEPVLGSGNKLGLDGFDHVPGWKPEGSVHTWHYYDIPALGHGTIDRNVALAEKVRQKLGGATFLSEWDVEYIQGNKTLLHALEVADANKLSWTGWEYKQFVRIAGSPSHGTLIDPRNATVRPEMAQLFSRPYPSSVHGELVSFEFKFPNATLFVKAKPNPNTKPLVKDNQELRLAVHVTEDEKWGWGEWEVKNATVGGKVVEVKRLEKEEDVRSSAIGSRWWVEQGYVEGSKYVHLAIALVGTKPADDDTEGAQEDPEVEVTIGQIHSVPYPSWPNSTHKHL